jgi:6-phosphogluconolactonase (cycloisomerase 2 family)
MVNFTILAGGYTSFVVSYLFNSDASSLTLLSQSPTGPNPSWIASHPKNRSILYAVNEVSSGAVQSFTVNLDGSLTGPIDQVSSGGENPAYLSALSTGSVAVMNYGSGNGEIISTTFDPLHFAQDPNLITFPPPDGGVSHPHMAFEHGGEVFVPDLVNNILCYSLCQFVN